MHSVSHSKTSGITPRPVCCCLYSRKCNYETTNPNGSCELCLKDPHLTLECGPKLRSKEDNRWAEWNSTDEFFAEIRQLVELRLQRGESQDDIRRLLQVSSRDDSPPLLTNNTISPPSTTSPLPQHLIPLEEPSSMVISASETTQMQWPWNPMANPLPMNYHTNPITSSSSADMLGNGLSPFQVQFSAPGISSEDYPPSSENSQASTYTSSFSNTISQDNIFPSYNFSPWPATIDSSTFPDQTQFMWSSEYVDSYGQAD
jgi:hypothetical protein